MKLFSITIVALWILAAMVGQILQLNPNAIQLNAILQTPSVEFWLGADDLGRSIAARLLHGFEVSMLVALTVTLVSMTIGVSIGLIAGFYGGKVDRVLMQITDIFSIPWDFISHCLCRRFRAGLGEFNDCVVY